MATIALDKAQVIGFWGRAGETPVTRRAKVTAGQTWKDGAFLKMTSGLLVICSANDAGIVGIATEDITNAASGSSAEFYPLTPDTLVEMNLYGAAAANETLDQTDLFLGVQYQITSNKFVLDITTTTPRFRIVGIEISAGKGVITDVNARVWAVPLTTACAAA